MSRRRKKVEPKLNRESALMLESIERKTVFEIKNGWLSIHDPDNCWKDWYCLNQSESIQLAKWILREQLNALGEPPALGNQKL